MPHPEQNQWVEKLTERLSVVRRFRAGDVCFLNSGSPALTVDRYRSDGVVEVAWHNGESVMIEAFPEVCLRRAGWWRRLCIPPGFGG